jgi:hypothetical protein
LAISAVVGLAGRAAAAEIKVLSAASPQRAVADLAEVCRREAGHAVWIIGGKTGRGMANV